MFYFLIYLFLYFYFIHLFFSYSFFIFWELETLSADIFKKPFFNKYSTTVCFYLLVYCVVCVFGLCLINQI